MERAPNGPCICSESFFDRSNVRSIHPHARKRALTHTHLVTQPVPSSLPLLPPHTHSHTLSLSQVSDALAQSLCFLSQHHHTHRHESVFDGCLHCPSISLLLTHTNTVGGELQAGVDNVLPSPHVSHTSTHVQTISRRRDTRRCLRSTPTPSSTRCVSSRRTPLHLSVSPVCASSR